MAQVAGYLVLPTGEAKGRVPAVVILHGSGGIYGRGEFHAKALNAAGIATLEVLMFTSGNRPRTVPAQTSLICMAPELPGNPTRHRSSAHRGDGSPAGWTFSFLHNASLTQRFTGGQLRFAAPCTVLSCVLATLAPVIRSKSIGLRRV